MIIKTKNEFNQANEERLQIEERIAARAKIHHYNQGDCSLTVEQLEHFAEILQPYHVVTDGERYKEIQDAQWAYVTGKPAGTQDQGRRLSDPKNQIEVISTGAGASHTMSGQTGTLDNRG